MLQLPGSRPLVFFGITFFLIIAGTTVLVSKFGGAYRTELMKLAGQVPTQELTLRQKKNIRKITVRKNAEEGCIEITPDGAVRVYTACGGELDNAARLTDLKNISKLFRLVSETNLAAYKNSRAGDLYEVILETDTGTETYYLIIDDNTPSPVKDIKDAIDDIEEDIPQPTPTPIQTSGYPTPTGYIGTVTPTFPWTSVTPTPTGVSEQTINPFICDFTETSGKKKPLNVSNIICSSGPTPAP